MSSIYRSLRTATVRSAVINNHLKSRKYATMSGITQWDRLIRYVSAKDGKVRYGEPIVSGSKPDIDGLAQSGSLRVKVLEGPSPLRAKPNGEEDEVKQLLGPLTPNDVPIIRCTGLNYKTHSKINMSPGKTPIVADQDA